MNCPYCEWQVLKFFALCAVRIQKAEKSRRDFSAFCIRLAFVELVGFKYRLLHFIADLKTWGSSNGQ